MALSIAMARYYRQIEREAKLNDVTFANCKLKQKQSPQQNMDRLLQVRKSLLANVEKIKEWSISYSRNPDAIEVGRSYLMQTKGLIEQVETLLIHLSAQGARDATR
jgi:hypothetical protein